VPLHEWQLRTGMLIHDILRQFSDMPPSIQGQPIPWGSLVAPLSVSVTPSR
jgi:hypothetical protein